MSACDEMLDEAKEAKWQLELGLDGVHALLRG